MLSANWQKEFLQPTETCIEFLVNIAEQAYEEGRVKPLGAVVLFLLQHQSCDESLLKKAAEAAIKTERWLLATTVLAELAAREPENSEYRIHWAEVLIAQANFSKALEVLKSGDNPPQTAELQAAWQATVTRAEQYQTFVAIKSQLLEPGYGSDLTSEQYIEHVEQLLNLAIEFSDRDSIVAIVSSMSEKCQLPDVFLHELCFALNTPEEYSYMSRLILSLSSLHLYPGLVRDYLCWMIEHKKEVPTKQLLRQLQQVKAPQEPLADITALLCALDGDWALFAHYVEQGMLVIGRIEALLRYAVSFWLQRSEFQKIELLIDNYKALSNVEIAFLAFGLREEERYIEQRFELLHYAIEEKATQAEPASAVLFQLLAECWLYKGDNLQAIQAFFKAYKADQEESFRYRFNLAKCLMDAGDAEQALQYTRLAVALEPDNPLSWRLVSELMRTSASWQLGYGALRLCLPYYKDNPNVWVDYSVLAGYLNQLAESRACLLKAREMNNNQSKELTNRSALNLCGLESLCGNIEAAIQSALAVVNGDDNTDLIRGQALSHVLFSGNYNPYVDTKQLAAWYRKINEFFPLPHFQPQVREHEGRRIRVGYVSTDLRRHPVAIFLEALLKHHDHKRFEIYAYSGVGSEDATSELLKEYIDHWKFVAKMPDQELAQLVRDDEIDVLVDLNGHTTGNRLRMFALRPCAVQVSWLGFAQTTGVHEMDYFLGDDILTPQESDSFFSEKPWRLPRASYCYTPSIEWRFNIPKLTEREAGAPIVFGNVGRAIRFNPEVLKVWKQILEEVPHSIIKIDNPNFKDREPQEMMLQRFEENGIPRERVWLGHSHDYKQSLLDIDIALDGFPQNSGTTLFEFLWCGVPIVTKKDRPSVGRLGAMVLHAVNRDEWIAETAEEYIQIAKTLASDPQKLFEIKKSLREELVQSELCDGPGFAKAVEDAYEGMLKEKALCQ